MMWKQALMLGGAAVLGAVAGFIMSSAGTGLAMRELMDLRDEQRDRMAAGLQTVIDTAATDLAAMQAQVTDLTTQLEARKPKDVQGA